MMSLQCDLKWSKSTWWLIKSVSQPIKTLIQVIIDSRLILPITLFLRNPYSAWRFSNRMSWLNLLIYIQSFGNRFTSAARTDRVFLVKKFLGLNWTSSYCYEILTVFELISFDSLNDISSKSNCQHVAHLEQVRWQHWNLKKYFQICTRSPD